MEGIETPTASRRRLCLPVSVGAPTWRGLKHQFLGIYHMHSVRVSRCPDMEGIETSAGARPP